MVTRAVAWRFADSLSAAERGAVLEAPAGRRVVTPTRSLAAGANLGLSARSLGYTYRYIGTWDDLDGLRELRKDTVHHRPAGSRLRRAIDGPALVLDVVG